VQGRRERLGVSSDRQLGSVRVKNGVRSFDVGLVEFDDVTDWAAQVFGMGELGEVVDLDENQLSLDLIGCPVRATGGVWGVLEGELQGLTLRYRCMGGRDYGTDLFIGPRSPDRPLATRPGDSGTD
jgi:hypothetical protein